MKYTPPSRKALAPLFLVALLGVVGCSGSPETVAPSQSAINATDFQQVIDILCDDVMEGRDAGTDGIDIARDYLVTKFTQVGLVPAFVVDGKLSYTQPLTIPIGSNEEGVPLDATISNVGAVLPGVGELADEVIVVGAHYDHIGYGHVGSRDAEAHGHIHPGADDNASGTAGVVLLARHFVQLAKQQGPNVSRRTILFTGFAGEERGLYGSRYMVQYKEQWVFDSEKVVAMINMDMIGRLRDDVVHVFGNESGEQWSRWVEAANRTVGLNADTDLGSAGSDHIPFINAGIPSVFFNTRLHEDYHTPRDTPDKINAEGGARVLRLVANLMEHTATTPERVTYVAPPPRQPRAYMGVMIDQREAGLVFSQVVDGGPAGKAGLMSGDLAVSVDGEAIEEFRDLRRVLRAAKPGDEVVVTIVRDGEEMEFTVELGGR